MRLVAVLLLSPLFLGAAEIPLRIDCPDNESSIELPVRGGVPFPKGALASVDQITLLSDGAAVPMQATPIAKWPDGSVKWALIDAVLAPQKAGALTLRFGPDVKAAAVRDGISAVQTAEAMEIRGGTLRARILKKGGGFIDEFTMNTWASIPAGQSMYLGVRSLRSPDGPSAPNAASSLGRIQIEQLAIASPGPIRVTVLIRGFILLEDFGATLPREVLEKEPAGRMPFSMRVSFHRGSEIVSGQHQIVFTGEPDCDFLTEWGLVSGWSQGRLIVEPGVAMDVSNKGTLISPDQSRLCWGHRRRGLALIRHGWENRPTAVTQSGLQFWAGTMDLRRYAREWSCGESGDTKNPKEIEFFAKYAARGMAKSHEFVIDFGTDKDHAKAALALSKPALLLAPPGWYASTGVFGPYVTEQTDGAFAAIDAATRRRIDYHLFCQDLYRWHGQLAYGFWQYRFGQMHRNDRWDCDYGRWGWSLNDGAGRIGHMLMLQFLRTQERRYFDAGEAFNRINYDTNLVHTELHLENSKNWWHARGYAHRHNV
ncbi:MAG TPA: hypothetical protein VEJ63_22820, partial [Planctomycetota bacterium]|nr:hypothetical protein [Planctomycetota bacterium]